MKIRKNQKNAPIDFLHYTKIQVLPIKLQFTAFLNTYFCRGDKSVRELANFRKVTHSDNICTNRHCKKLFTRS